MAVLNTLAYHDMVIIGAVKSFIVRAPGVAALFLSQRIPIIVSIFCSSNEIKYYMEQSLRTKLYQLYLFMLFS